MPPEAPATPTDDLLGLLPTSPDAYPHRLDLNGMAFFVVRLDAAAYRAASFLDDRVLGSATRGTWMAYAAVAEAWRRAGRTLPVHFVFHTGHVGSTLASRLLDRVAGVLSLREPLPLRTLADAHDTVERPDSLLDRRQFDSVLGTCMRLWGRGYGDTSTVIVKATSSAGRLAATILTHQPSSRAIYMNLRAEPYLATLLAGPNSAIDLRGHGPERTRRLLLRVAEPLPPLHSLSSGELAAMSWLAESWTRYETVTEFSDRVLPVDFERFLSDVPEAMGGILDHFGLPREAAPELGRSVVLGQYSKAPEYAYSPRLRAEVLRESRRNNEAEIRKGLNWLERIARSESTVSELLNEAAAA